MEFRLEERGISVESVGGATAAEPQMVPLEGWRWTRNSSDDACGGETNGSCV